MTRQIFLTGVSRGLGRAMVDEFIRLGHNVRGCARNEKAIEELCGKYGERTFQSLDITSDSAVEQYVRELAAAEFVPDLVINNAGLINANAELWKVHPAEFRRVFEVNVVGTYLMIRAFMPLIKDRGSGGFINFSSTWGRTTSPEVAPYCASKFAIEGLTKAFAAELSGQLFAVALNPGIINTEMLQSCFGNHAEQYPSPQPWARSAVPFLLQLGPHDNGRSLDAPA